MKELVITAWCDLCWLEETKTPSAQSLTLTVAAGVQSGPAKEMEFCAAHMEPLAPLLLAYERAPAKDAPQASSRPTGRPTKWEMGEIEAGTDCPVCGRTYVSGSSVISHIMRTHRQGEALYPKPLTCEVCGRTDFTATQGLANHLNGTHGVDMVARAAAPVLARAELKRRRTA